MTTLARDSVRQNAGAPCAGSTLDEPGDGSFVCAEEVGPSVTRGLVSVVIATYNCRRYLGQAIESVLGQTYQHLEVHVVDDGSTDGSKEEVERFLVDPRVRYHYQPNAGQTAAKNHGIRKSRGEFVAFCDADDIWLPEKLAAQVPLFADNDGLGVVYSRAALIDERGVPLEPDRSDEPGFPSGRVTAHLFKLNFVPFGTAVVRRRCLDELGAFDERYLMSIDWELWLRISLYYDFLFVDTETYVYRVWPGQMSKNWRGRYEHAFRIMREFLARYPGVIDVATEAEAWAHSYTQRARLRTFMSGEYGPAIFDVVRALRVMPSYRYAWRTFPVIALAAAGFRRT